MPTDDSRSSEDFKIIPVDTGGLVPPWVKDLPAKSTITEDYTLEMGLTKLPLTEQALEPGTEVQVITHDSDLAVRDWQYVEVKKKEKRRRRELRKKAHERAQARKQRLKRQERAEFWSQYTIPIPFKIATNTRITELRRGSSGTGRTQSTVQHFLTEEAFEDGRLKRDRHDFLCDNKGERWHYGIDEQDPTTDPGEQTPIVTCETCLKRMDRWKTGSDTGNSSQT